MATGESDSHSSNFGQSEISRSTSDYESGSEASSTLGLGLRGKSSDDSNANGQSNESYSSSEDTENGSEASSTLGVRLAKQQKDNVKLTLSCNSSNASASSSASSTVINFKIKTNTIENSTNDGEEHNINNNANASDSDNYSNHSKQNVDYAKFPNSQILFTQESIGSYKSDLGIINLSETDNHNTKKPIDFVSTVKDAKPTASQDSAESSVVIITNKTTNTNGHENQKVNINDPEDSTIQMSPKTRKISSSVTTYSDSKIIQKIKVTKSSSPAKKKTHRKLKLNKPRNNKTLSQCGFKKLVCSYCNLNQISLQFSTLLLTNILFYTGQQLHF